MIATYSQVKNKLSAAGYTVTKSGNKIKIVKDDQERVFANPEEALKWFKEQNNEETQMKTETISIKEAANMTIFELIAPSDRIQIEQKGYQLEELASLAEIENIADKPGILKALALKGLAFFYQADAWYPLPLR